MININALKKTIDYIQYNSCVGGMTKNDEIKYKEKNMREERKIQSVRDIEGVGIILNNVGGNFTTLGEVSSSTKWKSISSELTEDDLNIKNIAKNNVSSINMVGKVVINNQDAF